LDVEDEADIKQLLTVAFGSGFVEDLGIENQTTTDTMMSNLNVLMLTRDKIRDRAITLELCSGRLSDGPVNNYQPQPEHFPNPTLPSTM